MDRCAEFSLRLARTAQEALGPNSSPLEWLLFPQHRRASWTDAAALLADASKPVIVAPLVEPGSLAFWSLATVNSADRDVVARELANQCEYFANKIRALQLVETDHIETPDGEFQLTVSEFKQWAKDYTIPVGLGMIPSRKSRTGRATIRPPGGGRTPIGWIAASTR